MRLLTLQGLVVCAHEVGIVALINSQSFVRINGAPVLVEGDPESRPIGGCPNAIPPSGIKPCTSTLKAREGYSELVNIGGRRACLDTVVGFTDGTPPGTHDYKVNFPGQTHVASAL
ncbi:MAG: hypothetical protein AAF513_00885 [Pseudomonadota bacterium]